jgi:hypothetical protein
LICQHREDETFEFQSFATRILVKGYVESIKAMVDAVGVDHVTAGHA